ncbi:hypothetical protein SDC9_84937 [bioreactor metagenome]|uniref:Uncharacterized protein n=1 Tax=bioreactor metagenome TaxID=1076179 RepID=A0A644ZDB7_9ZZZZ
MVKYRFGKTDLADDLPLLCQAWTERRAVEASGCIAQRQPLLAQKRDGLLVIELGKLTDLGDASNMKQG